MTITVNGQPRQLPDGTVLAALPELDSAPARGTAAAVDGAVVPRSAWTHHVLIDGQAVELLIAVQGG
jgi:sulfur carrier protein